MQPWDEQLAIFRTFTTFTCAYYQLSACSYWADMTHKSYNKINKIDKSSLCGAITLASVMSLYEDKTQGRHTVALYADRIGDKFWTCMQYQKLTRWDWKTTNKWSLFNPFPGARWKINFKA